jgi:hypothetical protein
MYSRHCVGVLFFLFCISNLHAQDWLWALNAGGGGPEEAFSATSDQLGNVYLTGYFNSDTARFGSISLLNKGNNDVFIVKYDQGGNAVWARQAGGVGDDQGFSIHADPSGNVIVAGSFNSDTLFIGSMSLFNTGMLDFFVIKYDALGNILWAISAGGAAIDEAYALSTDQNANVYVTGHFMSDSIKLNAEIAYNGNPGFSEIFLIKLNAAGNTEWIKSATGNNNDIAYNVTTGNQNDIYITGFFRSLSITFEQEVLTNSAPARDVFIAKYNDEGELNWAKSFGAEQNDLAYNVLVLENDHIAVTGSFRSDSISFGNQVLRNTQAGTLDIFLVKYNSDGQEISVAGGGGPYDDYAFCLYQGNNSDLYVAGGFQSYMMALDTHVIQNAKDSAFDMFIAAYNMNDEAIWLEGYGGPEDDYFNWLTNDPVGNVYVAGRIGSDDVQIGPTLLQGKGDDDIFLAKFSTIPSSLFNHRRLNSNDITIYPNPSSGWFIVEQNDPDQIAQLTLFTLYGDQVLTKQFIEKTEVNLIPGVYILCVQKARQTCFEKVIIH